MLLEEMDGDDQDNVYISASYNTTQCNEYPDKIIVRWSALYKMAFLCPSRVGKGVKRKQQKVKSSNSAILGRITGSDSVDTLVRVGLEKQHGLPPNSKMVVLQDFTPRAEREMKVSRGEEVFLLYRENEWCYVITVDGREGFIPDSFCLGVSNTPSMSTKSKQSKNSPRGSGDYRSFDTFDSDSFITCVDDDDKLETTPLLSSLQNTRLDYQNVNIAPEVKPFRKTSHGQFIVLFDFIGLDENDATVERAELLDVLNIEDPDWSWVRRGNGEEGFVPKSYICPVEPLKAQEKVFELQNKYKKIHQTTPPIRQPLLATLSPRRMSQSSDLSAQYRNPVRPQGLIHTRYGELDQESNYSDTQKERRRSSSLNRVYGNTKNWASSDSVIGNRRSPSPSNRTLLQSEALYQNDDSYTSPPLIVYDQPQNSYNRNSRSSSPSSPPVYSQIRAPLTFNQTHRSRSRSVSPSSSVGYANVRTSSPQGKYEPITTRSSTASNQNIHLRGYEPRMKDDSTPENLTSINQVNMENISNTPKQNDGAGKSFTNGNVMTGFQTSGKSELVMMYDYKDEDRGGLSLSRGDLVYAEEADQTESEWLWVFYPPTSQYGYVPGNYVKSTHLKTTL